MGDNGQVNGAASGNHSPDSGGAETYNGPNVEIVLDEGPGDTTVRPLPDYLRPYLTWRPRPEKPPQNPDAPAA